MGLKKAKIKVEKGNDIQVMFNPAEYNIQESVTYTEKSIIGMDGKISQYISGENSELTMTLYFDTYKPPTLKKSESGTDVSKLTKKISKLTYIVSSLHRPPMVTFIWGALNFKGVITSVKHSYTMFLADGMPVRAKMDITFKSILDPDTSKRKTPFESPDRTKVRIVHEGEQLWHYAYKEYNDPELWRVIAKENNISNPLEIYPGQVINLPAL